MERNILKENHIREMYNAYCCLMAKYHIARPSEKAVLMKNIEELRGYLINNYEHSNVFFSC